MHDRPNVTGDYDGTHAEIRIDAISSIYYACKLELAELELSIAPIVSVDSDLEHSRCATWRECCIENRFTQRY